MSPLEWESPAALLVVLLGVGHLLADFQFQTSSMVRRKRTGKNGLRDHGLEVLAVHALTVLPVFPTRAGALAVLGIATAHVAIDRGKVALDRARPRRAAWWFALDQAAHVATLLAAAALWLAAEPELAPRLPAWLDAAQLVRAAVVVGAYAFCSNGAGAVVALRLSTPALGAPGSEEGGTPDGGRVIGILERWLLLTFVLLDQWGAIGLVLAAKSVARFDRLKDHAFAERYLVGTLTSVLVAVLTGLALRALLGLLGG